MSNDDVQIKFDWKRVEITETNEIPLRTPLYATYKDQNAKIVPFAGWEMPLQYSGILDEVKAVRERSGLFDVSHMCRVCVHGSGASDFIQVLTSNDSKRLKDGFGQYSLLLNDHGGIKDDILQFRLSENEYFLILNAGNTMKDLEWILQHKPSTVTLENITSQTAMIALQGPNALKQCSALFKLDYPPLERYQIQQVNYQNENLLVSRTGYTGEDGCEITAPASVAPTLWREIMDLGVTPCGLGARDTLRIEAGYPLYGHEIEEDVFPREAGLSWAVILDKGTFIGSDAIIESNRERAMKRTIGIVARDKSIPRQGYLILDGERRVGFVTSGTYSPTLNCGVGMVRVEAPFAKTGKTLFVEIRGKLYPVSTIEKHKILSTMKGD